MGTNLEIEFKSELSKQDYEKLVSKFSSGNIYSQTNYYIDTKNLEINKNKCGLRIREKNGVFEMTLKVPQKEGKLEINQQITDKLVKDFILPEGEIQEYLVNNLDIKTESLKILGTLKTYRLDLMFKTSLISIDKSIYNGITDYEIEAEDFSMEKASKNLIDFLNENQIKYKKSTGWKLKKFLDTLKN